MTKQEAINELSQYRKEKERARFLEDKIIEIRAGMEFPPHSDVFTDGGKGGTLEIAMDKLFEVMQNYASQMTYCFGVLNDVEAKVNMLDYPKDVILRQYYFQGKTLSKIAEGLNYSYESVKKKKCAALNEYCQLPVMFSNEYWQVRLENVYPQLPGRIAYYNMSEKNSKTASEKDLDSFLAKS